MTRFILRNKDSAGYVTYMYKSGYRARVKPNYERFLNDLMRYADASVDDVKTQEDLFNLFDRAKGRGNDFHESETGKQALITEWNRRGNELDIERNSINVNDALNISDEVRMKIKVREMRVFRRSLGKMSKGRKITDEESKILFKMF